MGYDRKMGCKIGCLVLFDDPSKVIDIARLLYAAGQLTEIPVSEDPEDERMRPMSPEEKIDDITAALMFLLTEYRVEESWGIEVDSIECNSPEEFSTDPLSFPRLLA